MDDRITLGILAGGRGARLGGADKAALRYRGETLLARTLAAFAATGEGTVLVSHRTSVAAIAPGDLGEASASHALRVVHDLRPGQPGPLAGLEALLAAAGTPWLLTTPVDLREVPTDLGARLGRAALSAGMDAVARAAVVQDADGLQPLVGLWPVATTLVAVRAALNAGQRSARALVATLPHALVDIAPARLGNLNAAIDFAA